MLLSNARKYFLITCFCAIVSLACGGSASNNSQISPAAVETPSEFPFVIKEPAVYQVEIVATGDGVEKKWLVARDGERWQIDFPANNEPSRTRMRLDVVYSIDHKRKVYAVAETSGETVAGLTDRFFKGNEYRKFEKLGGENGVTLYRIANKGNLGEVVLSVDDSSGMVTREELVPAPGSGVAPFVYEMRSFKTNVDDGLFTIPAGYKKVTLAEYQQAGQK